MLMASASSPKAAPQLDAHASAVGAVPHALFLAGFVPGIKMKQGAQPPSVPPYKRHRHQHQRRRIALHQHLHAIPFQHPNPGSARCGKNIIQQVDRVAAKMDGLALDAPRAKLTKHAAGCTPPLQGQKSLPHAVHLECTPLTLHSRPMYAILLVPVWMT